MDTFTTAVATMSNTGATASAQAANDIFHKYPIQTYFLICVAGGMAGVSIIFLVACTYRFCFYPLKNRYRQRFHGDNGPYQNSLYTNSDDTIASTIHGVNTDTNEDRPNTQSNVTTGRAPETRPVESGHMV